MNWTDEQREVIESRGQSLLVSAAAGSGKTAVLVERIMRMLTDPLHPVDIDRLLVVTFTRAAAGEMKSRLAARLADAREADPDNDLYARELALLPHAQITTIDGFCSYVVRNYGFTRDLSPDFRVTSEGERKLLMHDVADTVIGAAYEELAEGGFPEFQACVDSLTGDRSDDRLEELILKISAEADSHADPDAWLSLCTAEEHYASPEAMEEAPWLRLFMERVTEGIREAERCAAANLELARREDGPSAYLPAAEAEAGLIRELLRLKGYGERRKLIMASSIPRLSSARPKKGEDASLRDTFKKNRTAITGLLKDLEEIFAVPPETAWEDLLASGAVLRGLAELVRRFREAFSEEKTKRGIMDFPDLEHHALHILREGDERTETARELSALFEEVMVDEYQDSNELQEAILTAVSRIGDGGRNYFCVGDVKQSIYSFRQARPQLFMEKYTTYPLHPEVGRRIDLHRNFRSRGEVVDTVNGVFRQIMGKDTGGIDYDDDAALAQAADYRIAGGDGADFRAELLAVCVGERDSEDEVLLEENAAKREAEVRAVGQRILRLVREERIEDAETHGLRPVRFGDIAILMRSVSATAEQYVRILGDMQIPVRAEVRGGYFDAPEVKAVLSFLSILDNPEDDISLVSVLRSGFAEFTAEEMALVRTVEDAADWTGSRERNAVSMFDALRRYAEAGEEAGLRERSAQFLELYAAMRKEARDLPLHSLIHRLLDVGAYYDYVSAMPGGAQRALNLTMLIDQAAAYEKTSYVGLFNFVRYIRRLRKQEQDMDAGGAPAADGDSVSLTTIHKSKGLEYPIVILAGTARRFNRRDYRSDILLHPEAGIVCDYVDTERRVRRPTLKKLAVKAQMERDAAGEELRVLYVAMTRARQKLIMTASVKDEEALAGMDPLKPLREERFSGSFITKAGSFFEWLAPAVLRMGKRAELAGGEAPVRLLPVYPSTLASEEVQGLIRTGDLISRLLEPGADERVWDAELKGRLEERLFWRYPYAGRDNVPVELSVSEIKRMEHPPYEGEVIVPEPVRYYGDYPDGDGDAAPLKGAERGTAYHRVMELLDFAALPEDASGEAMGEAVMRQMEEFFAGKLLEEDALHTVRAEDAALFAMDALGDRMREAQKRQELYREQPFVLEMPASSIRPEWPEDETVFVQGIVDVFFYEEGEIILLDYKTDRVREAEELVRRYRVQLDSYAEALSRATGRRVAEKWIWSFHLGTAVML